MNAPRVWRSSISILIGLAGLFSILVLSSLSFRNRDRTNVKAPAQSPSHAAHSPGETTRDNPAFQPLPELSTVEAPPKSNPAEDLRFRLARFKRWQDGLRDREEPDYVTRFRLAREELRGVRELILADPRSFLEWLSDPSNSACVEDLVGITLTNKSGPYQWTYASQAFDPFPPALMEGTLLLLQTGSAEVRVALLEFSQTLKNPPPPWRTQFLAMLQEPNTRLADQAAKSLMANRQATHLEVRAIIDLADRSHRSDCLSLANAVNRDPKWREWLLGLLETGAIEDARGLKTQSALEIELSPMAAPTVADRARGSSALQATLRRLTDPKNYSTLVWSSLGLQLDANQVREALALSAATAPTDALRRAASESLSHPDLDTADLDLRRSIWKKAYDKYHPRSDDWE